MKRRIASRVKGMLGLYVHVPYCSVRCSYCDFYLVPSRGRRLDDYAAALCGEIAAVGPPLRGRSADTIHFGGGTPSLLAAASLGKVLRALSTSFSVSPAAELTLEANPEDVDSDRLGTWAGLGMTRLTVGVQSLDDRLLAMMRRPHTARGALRALEQARRSSIRSLGADLMLGLPGQDRQEALQGVARLVDCGVDHLALYLLESHARTRLGRELALGRRAPMDADAAAALYEEASDLLLARGFEHYEISNFARAGHRSHHNLKYWTDEEYLGFGPSAHSYALGRRFSNLPDLERYVAQVGVGLERVFEPPRRGALGVEALVAGLRLLEGVDLTALRSKHGEVVPEPWSPQVAVLREAGLMEVAGPRLRLTRRGRLVSNEVLERLLPSPPAEPVAGSVDVA